MEKVRKILMYKSYFVDFYSTLPIKTQKKFIYAFSVIEVEPMVPIKFLKQIEGEEGLYEVRVDTFRSAYRVFCCFDKGNLVVLFNGFLKKTQKTSKDQINRAKYIMNDYFNDRKDE